MGTDHRFAIRAAILAAVVASFVPACALAQQRQPPAQAPAQAPAPQSATPRPLGTFDGWRAFEAGPNNAKICYLTARPTRSESRPANAQRAEISLVVAHHQNPRRNDEFTMGVGYPARDGGEIEIGRTKVALSTLGQANPQSLWAREADGDRQIVAALRAAPATGTTIVRGTSARGTETTDHFALAGFQRALAEIDRACGVRRQ
jgi:invasion protein IalB